MKKVFKRIAAMSAAVMMVASISSMGVSAADGYSFYSSPYTLYDTISSGKVTSYGKVTKTTSGSSYKITSYASTGINKSTGGANVSTSICFKKSNSDSNIYSVGNGSGGKTGANTSKSYTVDKKLYKYAHNSHVGFNQNVRNIETY